MLPKDSTMLPKNYPSNKLKLKQKGTPLEQYKMIKVICLSHGVDLTYLWEIEEGCELMVFDLNEKAVLIYYKG